MAVLAMALLSDRHRHGIGGSVRQSGEEHPCD
jgi:hypothetical protein